MTATQEWKTMYDGARAAYLSPKRINWGWCDRQQEYGYFIDDRYSGSDLDGVFFEIGDLVESGKWLEGLGDDTEERMTRP